MKKSKRPVFKLNTSELPKGYKQPIKPKKRKGHRGPRRIVRSRRRNEFIPEGADWCEINGQKLRQDIFFGEKRGRKFIPGRLLGDAPDFFVPSGAAADSAPLLEAPYGDGGDGGSCGCACEGCVCGEGEGCSCSGPGTDSDTGGFAQGAQDGQQGQQGGPSGYDDTGVGSPGGPSGFESGYQGGYDNTGVGSPGGPSGFESGYQGGYDNTGVGSPGGPSGFESGYQGGYDNTGVGSPGGPSGFDVGSYGGPSFADPYGDFAGPNTFADPYGDFRGPNDLGLPGINTNPDIAERGTFDPYGPSQYSFMDDRGNTFTGNPSYMTDQTTMNARDGQINSALAPGERGPASPFAQQDLIANPLNPQDIMNIDPKGIDLPNVAPLNIGPTSLDLTAITAMERGQQPETARGVLDPINPQEYQGPFQPAEPDAKGAIPATPDDVKGIIDAISNTLNAGQIGRAGAAEQFGPTSQFGPLTSSLYGPNYTANPLAENPFSNPLSSNVQSTFTTAPTVGPNPTGFSVDPGKSVGPVNVDPEAPGRTMEAPHNQPSIAELWEGSPSISRGAEQTNPFAPNPYVDNPEPPVHNQPSIAELWEGTPSISRSAEQTNPFVSNPYADNPDIIGGPNQFTGQTAPGWFTGEFGNQTMGRDAPTNWGNPEAPTAEQMQAARDAMTELAGREQSQNPLSDLFGRDVTDPAIFAPADRGRTMDAPHNQPSLDEFWEGIPSISRSQEEQIGREHVNPLERGPEEVNLDPFELDLREQEDRAAHVNPLAPVTSRDVPTTVTAPSRGQEARGQERGTQFVPTSRGQTQALGRGITSLGRGPTALGRDAPGVQGLPAGLRGNEIAQALVGRGFDPNLVGAALTINDGGKMLSSMLEAAGLSHSQAQQTANAARGAVEAQFGLPSNRR